jgi:hypothetical protein
MTGVLAKSLGWEPGTAEMTRRVDPWPAAAFAAAGPGAPPDVRRRQAHA